MSISGIKRQRVDPVEMGEDLEDLRYIPTDDERELLSRILQTGYVKPSVLVSAISQAVTPILESIQTIAEDVQAVENEVDQIQLDQELADKLETIEETFEGFNEAFNLWEAFRSQQIIKNATTEADLTATKVDLTATKATVAAQEAQIVANTSGLAAAGTAIATLQTELASLASFGLTVDIIQSLIDAFGTASLASILSSVKTSVTELTTRVKAIEDTYVKTTDLNASLALYQTLQQQEVFQQNLPNQYVQAFEIQDLQASIDALATSIPSLDGYATSAWVTQQIESLSTGEPVDLSAYALKSTTDLLQTQVTALTQNIINLEPYATPEWVSQQITTQLTPYALKTYVTEQIAAIPAPPPVDLSLYALQTWVTEQLAQASSGGTVDLSSYATNASVDQKISTALTIPNSNIEALQAQTASIQTQVLALPTVTYVNNQINSFVTTPTFQGSVDTRVLQKVNPEISRLEGMIGNISTSNQNLSVSYDALYTLVQSINPVTQSDVEALFLTFSQNYTNTTNLNILLGGYTPIGLFTSLSDNLPVAYATKDYVTQQISNSNASDATQSWVTQQLGSYSTTTQMNTAISNAIAPLATATQLENYSTTTQMNTAISTATAPLATTAQLASYATTTALQSAQTSLTSYSNNKILLGWCYVGDPGSSASNNTTAATFAGYTLGQFGGAIASCSLTSFNVSDQQQCYTVVNITWTVPADTPANSRYHPVFVVGDLAYPTTDDGRATNYLSIPIVKKSLTATGCTFQIRDQFGSSTQSFQNGNALVYVMLVRRDNVM